MEARMGSEARTRTLSEDEQEFIAEMSLEPGTGWANFDPPFLRRYVARLERWGWLETRGKGRDAEHRWTDAGRLALAQAQKDGGRDAL
jgi:hypothetical protein